MLCNGPGTQGDEGDKGTKGTKEAKETKETEGIFFWIFVGNFFCSCFSHSLISEAQSSVW